MADVNGTNGNDTLIFTGSTTHITMTLVNPYDNLTLNIDADYNYGATTYDGMGGTDTLLMTSQGDAIFLNDPFTHHIAFQNIEQVQAGGGNDLIDLADSTVTLGPVSIDGGAGDDILFGNVGNDVINGRGGNDIIDSGPGNDTVDAGDGNDIVYAGDGNDTITGGTGADVLHGGNGDDIFNATADTAYGVGATVTNSDTGATVSVAGMIQTLDVFDGGPGYDILNLTGGSDVLNLWDPANMSAGNPEATPLRLISIEEIHAGAGDDVINLTDPTQVYGDVKIYGEDGNDTIWSGAGNDFISGGNGNDTLDGGAGNDVVHGDAGDDTLIYTAAQNVGATDNYDGGTGNDTLVLRLTGAEANADAADITAAQTFITANNNVTSDTGLGASYTFSSFGLTISNIESMSVIITSNTPPVANEDDFTGLRNQAITGDVLLDNGHGADSDPDGDAISVQAATMTTAHGGNVVLNADGTFTYTPTTGYAGADTFTYTLNDTHGASTAGTVNLTIDNQPPVAQPDTISDIQNHAASGNVLSDNGNGADSDPDGGTLSVTAGTVASANGGSAVLNADGTFTYTPAAGFTGSDSFTYTLNDGQGGNATGTVTMTVTPNHAPVAQEDDFAAFTNQSIAGNVLADNGHGAASDADGDPLHVTPASFATANGGAVVLNADGTFTYTPATGYGGPDSVQYTVSDGFGGQSTGTVNLTLTDRAPVAQNDSFTVAEDQVLHGNVLADNGHGADADPDGDTIAVTAGSFATAHGSVTIQANGDFTYTSNALFFGSDSFTYTESDPHGLQSGAMAGITVTSVNHNPVAQEDDFTGVQNTAISGSVLLNNGHGVDSDPDGDALSVQAGIVATASGGEVNLHADGTFAYTPATGFTGTDTFDYTLLDGHGGQATGMVDLTVTQQEAHAFSSDNVLFPMVHEEVNIANLVPPGTPALGVIQGDLDAGAASASATITFVQSVAGYANTLGSFEIAADGTITSAAIDFANGHTAVAGETATVSLDAGTQLGLFIISNGFNANNGFSGINLNTGTLNFIYDYGHADQRAATIDDSGSHISLVYTDASDHSTVLQGTDYFTTGRGGSTEINTDDAVHVIAGAPDAGDTSDLRIGFEDLPNTGDADYNDVIADVSFHNVISGGAGDDVLYATGSNGDVLTGGAGADRFVFTVLPTAANEVKDFNVAEGDKLDFSSLIETPHPAQAAIDQYIQATTQGGNTVISVDPDGAANGSHFVAVAVLDHVTGFDVHALLASGNVLA